MRWDIYGIQIIIRKANSEFDRIVELLEERDEIIKDEDLVCLLLFRKIIEKMDAIFILHDNGHESSSQSLARDLYENYLYLLFLIKDRYEYRAKAYLYQNMKSQLDTIDWMLGRGDKSSDLLVDKNKVLNKKEQYRERKIYLLGILESEEFKNISLDWNRKVKAKKNGGKYPTWYNIGNSVDSIAKLSDFVGHKKEFKKIYSFLSYEVHSLNAFSQITKVNNQALLTPIRDDVEKSFSLELACLYGAHSMIEVVKKLDADSKDNLADWYFNKLPKEIIAERKLD